MDSGLVLIIAIIVAYFIPLFIAYGRHHHNRGAIAAVNILLGWSVLGWIGAFVWALTKVDNK